MEKNQKEQYLKKQFNQLNDNYSNESKKYEKKLDEFDNLTSSIIKSQDILSELTEGLIGEDSDRMIRETNSVFEELSFHIKKDREQMENDIEDLKYEVRTKKQELKEQLELEREKKYE